MNLVTKEPPVTRSDDAMIRPYYGILAKLSVGIDGGRKLYLADVVTNLDLQGESLVVVRISVVKCAASCMEVNRERGKLKSPSGVGSN